jgi:hypothetical protein
LIILRVSEIPGLAQSNVMIFTLSDVASEEKDGKRNDPKGLHPKKWSLAPHPEIGDSAFFQIFPLSGVRTAKAPPT